MATSVLNGVIRNIRRTLIDDATRITDGQLMEALLSDGEGAAFESLVRRHGPMVLGVCRRVLRNEADAEDSFQATFLVFIRKAGSISPPEKVGNWLHGVALRTALAARKMGAKRRAKERKSADLPQAGMLDERVCEELLTVLDEEISCKVGLKGAARTAILTASGSSQMLLADLLIDEARVHLAGKAAAQTNVVGKMEYVVNGNPTLANQGSPVFGKKGKHGASVALR
jgi:RNA polymerase sigma factor (sigma-70 family)